MPIARFEMSDGKIGRFEVPEGTAPEQAQSLIQAHLAAQPKPNSLQEAFDTKKGLFGRIGDDYQERMGQAGVIAEQAVTGNISTPEAVVRGALKLPQVLAVDAPVEIAKSAYGSLPDAVTEPINKGVSSAASYIAASPVGDLGRAALQKVGEFQQNHPIASSRIGSVFDLGNIVAPFTPIGKSKSAVSAIEQGTKSTARALGTAALPNVDEGAYALAQRAKELNIPLKVSQISNSKPAKILNSVTEQLPFNGSQAFEETQQASFNRALSKTLGQDAENLGPDTVNAFRKSNAEKYSQALSGQDVSFTSDFGDSLRSLTESAEKSIDPGLFSVVKRNADDLLKDVEAGVVSGDKVNSIRSELLKRSTQANGPVKTFLGNMIDHIDDAVVDSLSPDKAKLLKEASREWRNYKTLEPLLKKSVDGNISPALINQRVAGSKFINSSRSAIGSDDIVDLGRIGQKFLKQQVPDSGTAQRMAFQKGLVQGGGTIAGAVASLPGTVAGLAAGRGLQALNRNQAVVEKALTKKAAQLQALQAAFEARKIK